MLKRLEDEVSKFENSVKGKNRQFDDVEIAVKIRDLGIIGKNIILDEMPVEIKKKGENDQDYIEFYYKQKDEVDIKVTSIVMSL